MTAERHYCHQTAESVTVHADEIADAVDGLVEIDASQVTSGTFPDARVAASNVTQHRAAAATGWVWISRQSAVGLSAVEFTGLSTYARYRIDMHGVLPSNDGVSLFMRVSTNNGSSYDSGAATYNYVLSSVKGAGTAQDIGGAATAFILVGNSSGWFMDNGGAISAWNGHVELYNASQAAHFHAQWKLSGGENSASDWTQHNGSGRYNAAVNVNAARIAVGSGTFTTGIFDLYGLKAS